MDEIEASASMEAATLAAETVTDNMALMQLFEQMDNAAPLMRLIIAGTLTAAALLLMLISRMVIRRRLARLEAMPEEAFDPLRWQAQDLFSREDMKRLWLSIWKGVGWLTYCLLMLVAAIGLLMTNSITLELAAGLITLFVTSVLYVWSGFVAYLPNLITILVIVLIARFLLKLIGVVFDGIKNRRIFLKNFYPEWADTSYGIIRLMVYALSAVIIFPYLPGSSSPAFQGISIFVGVLLSLGSTTAVSNVIAGVVLTYTRAFEVGDQLKLSDIRGRVVERSTFVTRIQTPKNVVVSIPNSVVLNNNIINYSKNMGRSGLLVHTTITIGYDVPWKTVNELLIEAARQTEAITDNPEPFVLQTSLDDNYVSYEINGWTRKPEELPKIYSQLHANILDQFHGRQVEITSPHYRAVRDGNPITVPPLLSAEEQESPG